MPDEQQQDQRSSIMECSPRRLAKKIESCIVRNALDEEERAQKALYLLKSRDRRIAYLEKRVAELQIVADQIHMSVQSSARSSNSVKDAEESFNTTKSERFLKTDKSDREFNQSDFNKTLEGDSDTVRSNQMLIPQLQLSQSSVSNSEKEVFSTATDLSKCTTSIVRISNEDRAYERTILGENKPIEKIKDCKSETKARGSNDQEKIDKVEKNFLMEERGKSAVSMRSKEKRSKKQRCRFPRTTSSVPWIRAKQGFRKKLRSFEVKTGKRLVELLSVGDGCSNCATSRKNEVVSTDQRQAGEHGIVDGDKKLGRRTVAREQDEAIVDAEGTHLIACQKINTVTKTIFTQTVNEFSQTSDKILQVNEPISNMQQMSCTCCKENKIANFHNDEEPAPQWLIEEALNREAERSERWTNAEISLSKETEYQKIISELEEKLTRTREDLDEALESKSHVKEKYKRTMENMKMEARKENEMLQEKIVRVCIAVLEHFGPNAMADKRKNNYQLKCRRPKYHEKMPSRLHKKLRIAVAKSSKLKRELAAARRTLENKSEMYESINKCFDELKREMNATETNLNSLISENLSLKKKMEETKNWLGEHNAAKEHFNHFRDAHKNRELTNLKKKAEEDNATIAQLRSRLVRSESANANKGFLLNSYKSQLNNLNKEKEQLVSKINGLENEISAARNNNSQLKAKIAILNNEKNKLHYDNEKSKTDITDKMQMEYVKKCEDETEAMKAKYEDTIKSIKMKMTTVINQNSEYLKAIREFLRKIYNEGNYVSQTNSNDKEIESEREAHKTACNILNMTPEELLGFINEKAPNSINTWMVELNRILAEDRFSENLSRFLFKKATKKLRT